tara:strand:+ start:1583 stop:2389 length:807 start_codon:yes stop_codon:yes gene_type:complete
MIKKILTATSIVAVSAMLTFPTFADDAKVLATVNGENIMLEDVKEFYQASPAAQRGIPFDGVKDAIVDQMISMKLIDKKISETNFAKKEEVERQVEEVKKQVLRDLWIQEQVEARLTEDFLKEKYAELQANLADQYEIKASHILLDTKEAADEVVKELDDGADFAELAKEKSIGPSGKEGGDLGFFTKGAMVPAFSEKAFSMDVGTYSKEPVETQFGWHVIKVEDKKSVEAPSYEEMKPRLEAEASRSLVAEVIDELQKDAEIVKKAE